MHGVESLGAEIKNGGTQRMRRMVRMLGQLQLLTAESSFNDLPMTPSDKAT